jgi:hypothetical protein
MPIKEAKVTLCIYLSGGWFFRYTFIFHPAANPISLPFICLNALTMNSLHRSSAVTELSALPYLEPFLNFFR